MLGLNEYLQVAVGVFALLSPFSAIPIFLSLTSSQSAMQRKKTAMTAFTRSAMVMYITFLAPLQGIIKKSTVLWGYIVTFCPVILIFYFAVLIRL